VTASVLLLHGIGGGRAIWGDDASDTVRALQEAGCAAEAIDFPGYGGRAGEPTFNAMVHAVLEATPGEGAVLLGHSMGGMVAQAVAARQPQRVRGLVLACTSAAFGKPGGEWQARFVAERLAPLDAGLGMPGMAARLVPGLVSPQARPGAAAVAQAVMARVPEATYRVALQAIAGFDGRQALPRLSMPTLVLAAEHDRTAPPEVMQRMAERIPGSTYRCLAAAGHIANVEQPQAFNAAVLAFLRQHFAGA
jgi:3-oxoadipate enol-lactonase